eukprot:s441_g16.t2
MSRNDPSYPSVSRKTVICRRTSSCRPLRSVCSTLKALKAKLSQNAMDVHVPWHMHRLHRLRQLCQTPVGNRFPRAPQARFYQTERSSLLKACLVGTGVCAFRRRRQLCKAASALRFPASDEGWLDGLREHGVVVIEEVLQQAEVQELKDLVWQWLEGYGGRGQISRDDPTTWTMADERWPKDNRSTGIVCVRGAGQALAAWKVRGHPAVQSIFAKHWDVEPEELLTSMDGLILWRPWQQKPQQVLEKWKTRGSWLHVDQNVFKRNELLAVQGLMNLCLADPSTGGFVCIPGSHGPAFQEKICESLGGAQNLRKRGDSVWRMHNSRHPAKSFANLDHPKARRGDYMALEEDSWSQQAVGISLNPGDMVLWDGRLVHGSEPAPGLEVGSEVESESAPELLRMAIPVCMVPRHFAQNQEELAAWRAQAVADGVTTKHWPQKQRTQGEAAGLGFVPPELSSDMLRVL